MSIVDGHDQRMYDLRDHCTYWQRIVSSHRPLLPIAASSFRDFHESQERARMRDYALHPDVNALNSFAIYISSTYVGFSSDLLSSIDSTISMGFADSMGPRWISLSPLWVFVLAANLGTAVWSPPNSEKSIWDAGQTPVELSRPKSLTRVPIANRRFVKWLARKSPLGGARRREDM